VNCASSPAKMLGSQLRNVRLYSCCRAKAAWAVGLDIRSCGDSPIDRAMMILGQRHWFVT
jgi:hypothetical protein